MVLATLGGSAWLFWNDRSTSGDEPRTRTETTVEDVDTSNDVLSIPDEEDLPEDRTETKDTGEDATPEDLPSTFSSLRDRRIALAAASSSGSGTVDRLVDVEGLKVACATPAAGDILAYELALAGATSDLLTRARATIVGADDEGTFRATSCVDERVAAFRDADVAMVYRVVAASTAPRVLVGRASGAPQPDSVTLAAELAAALELKGATAATAASTRSLLARAGAIDAAEGADVVLVELPDEQVTDDAKRESVVRAIVGAIATHLSRADNRER